LAPTLYRSGAEFKGNFGVRTLWKWLPDAVDARVRFFAWASLISQILIIGTGGAVRLTGSGLGCPTWPRCTEDSYVTTPEMGFHGIIEFGNRLLTFVLIIIAIGMFLMVVRMRGQRPELLRLSVALGLGIPGQAVIGGITVLTDLNPYVVGLHYLLSAVLVGLAAWLLYRVRIGGASRRAESGVALRTTLGALLGTLAISIVVGILVTGSGPHAGDGGAARNGLDSEFLQHIHSWPSYATFALAVVATWLAKGQTGLAATRRLQRVLTGLWLAIAAQIAIGLYQARNGLPELAVGIHMVLASVLVALTVMALLATRADRSEQERVGQSRPRETAASSS
jgi:cytochrome c oxidase assembly protein subunit 15